MKIKLSISILKQLTNNEAYTYFCTLVSLANNPNSTIKDIIRLSNVCENTIFNHLKKFEKLGGLIIDRNHPANIYSYEEPTKFYVVVDSSLLEIPVDRVTIGFLVRFKCWSRIADNIIDLSLNRIVKEIKVQHSNVYEALEADILERSEKKLYFIFKHPALTLLE